MTSAGPQLLLELQQVAPRIRKSSPGYRRTDPISSRLAAEELVGSGKRAAQQEMVLAIVKKYPHHTSLEMSAKSGVCRYVIGRRLSDLKDRGLVKRSTNVYQCTVGRRPAHRWSAL